MKENKFKNIITVTGNIAAGKTYIVDSLAKILNMKTYSGSESFRKLARKHKMSVTDFNEYVIKYPEVDRKIDATTARHIKRKNNIIVDARLGWYVIPNSFKVYIKVDMETATTRLVEESKKRGKEEQYINKEEAKKAIISREKFERARYIKEYSVDLLDEKNYDFIIDTSKLNLKTSVDIIKEAYEKYKEEKKQIK